MDRGEQMRKAYFSVVYAILAVVSLVLASGAPASYSGFGGR